MRRKHLLIFASVIWGIPGIIITTKGIIAYTKILPDASWYLFLVTVLVVCGFYFIFRKIVNKYSQRIISLKGKVRISQTFPVKGWILLAFMMSLGIILKNIPQVPLEFTASFYSGLGPMLILSSIRFLCIMLNAQCLMLNA